jgi:hypothetical protein
MVPSAKKSDFSFHRKSKMAAGKKRSGYSYWTAWDNDAISPTFSTSPDLDMKLSILPDICRRRPTTEFKMAATETGSGNNYWTQWAGDMIPTATCTFEAMPDTSLALPTLTEVGRLPEFKMATTEPEVVITFERWEMEPRFQLTPILSDCPIRIWHCRASTLSDVGRLPKFKIAVMETGSGGRHLEFR